MYSVISDNHDYLQCNKWPRNFEVDTGIQRIRISNNVEAANNLNCKPWKCHSQNFYLLSYWTESCNFSDNCVILIFLVLLEE